MGKRIFSDLLNGLRIVLFWILVGFVALGVMSAYKEMHVDVTVADGIVGESIVVGSYSTEYSCIVNGSEVKLYDTASHVPGDRVLVIVRNGDPYAIVSSDKVDSYTSMPSLYTSAFCNSEKPQGVQENISGIDRRDAYLRTYICMAILHNGILDLCNCSRCLRCDLLCRVDRSYIDSC